MLPTEIGMEISEVIKNNAKLEAYISTEKKIDYTLFELKDSLKEAYKSSNSKMLDYKNIQISNSEFAKLRNLRSYKQYIDKYIYKYKALGDKERAELAALNSKLG